MFTMIMMYMEVKYNHKFSEGSAFCIGCMDFCGFIATCLFVGEAM